jgi:hypothetical protein
MVKSKNYISKPYTTNVQAFILFKHHTHVEVLSSVDDLYKEKRQYKYRLWLRFLNR